MRCNGIALAKLDLFGEKFYLNVRPDGQKVVQTTSGAIFSIAMVFLMAIYFSYAIDIVWNKTD